MIMKLHDRLQKKEGGFTLIELMVVVLIIAILIAIAIPTFLGARKRAQDRQAQSNIRNALLAQKTFYTDNQVYADDTVAGDITKLQAIESSLTFTNAPTTADPAQRQVGFTRVTDQAVCIGSLSKSGTVFLLFDVASDATAANAGTFYSTGGTCPTAVGNPPTGGTGTWSKSSW